MPRRYSEIDFLRGLAIVLMIAFHAVLDLKMLGTRSVSRRIELPRVFWEWFPSLSWTIFLILVGVSAVLATHQASRPFRKILRQSLKVLAGAGLVTLGSIFITPQTVVHFGVLHCIGVSLLLIYPLLNYTRVNLVLGLGILAAGEALGKASVSSPWLMAIGLKPAGFRTGDYFPLVPFLGLVLLGISLGRILYLDGRFQLNRFPKLSSLIRGKLGRGLQFLGRHSLLIYLLHQPILLLAFHSLGLLRPL